MMLSLFKRDGNIIRPEFENRIVTGFNEKIHLFLWYLLNDKDHGGVGLLRIHNPTDEQVNILVKTAANHVNGLEANLVRLYTSNDRVYAEIEVSDTESNEVSSMEIEL